MSGRKASEVNSLLRNAEQTRSASINIFKRSYTQAKNSIVQEKRGREECEKEIEQINFTISENAKKEFPDIAEKLEKQIKNLKAEKQDVLSSLDSSEYDNILSKYDENDKKADKVRKDIQKKISSQSRHDPWYCDREYSRASAVQREYKALSMQVTELINEYMDIEKKSKSNINSSKMRLEYAQKLKKSIDDLENKADEIKKMRHEASNTRESIKKEFAAISNEIANKFLASEYKDLDNKVKDFVKLEDKEIIENCTEILSDITAFVNKLDSIYGEYKKKKEGLKTELSTLQDRVNNPIFSDPEDEFRATEKNMNSLVDFLKKYSKEDYPDRILKEIKEADNLIENDQFDEVENVLQNIEKTVAEASAFATRVHENKMKAIYNMLSIEKAMLELNYDVCVTENPDGEDGYCVECRAGDECITFDKVTVVDDGKVIITIDHKEATKGSCSASWHDIRQKLANEGLFFEDITKDGVSIHAPNDVYKTTPGNQQVTQNI